MRQAIPAEARAQCDSPVERAAELAMAHAELGLRTLRKDIKLSGTRSRQRRLLRRISDDLGTVAWLIDFENSKRAQG